MKLLYRLRGQEDWTELQNEVFEEAVENYLNKNEGHAFLYVRDNKGYEVCNSTKTQYLVVDSDCSFLSSKNNFDVEIHEDGKPFQYYIMIPISY